MATAASVLEIKIRAIIEGLEQLIALKESLGATGVAAETAGTKATTAKAPLKGVGESAGQASPGVQTLAEQLKSLSTKVNEVAGGGLAGLPGALAKLVTKSGESSGAMGVLGEAFGLVKGVAGPLLAALGAFAGIKISFDYLKDAAEYAARVQVLGTTLRVIGENSGYSVEELDKFEKALSKQGISVESSRTSMTAMMQAGISLTGTLVDGKTQVEQLARAAQDLAVVTGVNSSDAFSRLIVNIQQMDTMGLRYMGLTVDITAAQQQFAAEIGTTADALTQSQKMQAVANGALKEAAKLSGTYEAALGDVGKQVTSLKRYQEDLSDQMGRQSLPAYLALVEANTALLKGFMAQAVQFNETTTLHSRLANAVKAVVAPMNDLYLAISGYGFTVADSLGPAIEYAGEAFGSIIEIVSDLAILFMDAIGMPVLLGVVTALTGALAFLADGFKTIQMVVNLIVGLTYRGLSQIISLVSSVSDWLPIPDSWKKSLEGMNKSFQDSADKSIDKASLLYDEFARGDSATREWWTTMAGTSEQLKAFQDQLSGSRGTVDGFQTSIMLLRVAQNSHTASVTDLQKGYKAVTVAMDEAKTKGALTEAQYAALKGSITELSNGLAVTLVASFKEAKTGSAAYAETIMELKRAQTDNTLSSVQLKQSYDNILASMASARDSGTLTEAQYNSLNAKLAVVVQKMGTELTDAFTLAGTGAEELATNVSMGSGKISSALSLIAENGLATADQFYNAFSDKVTTAKNIEELDRFSQALTLAGNRWPGDVTEFREAQAGMAASFDDIYTKQLKSMTTSTQWDTLKASIIALGTSGVLTGSQVETALEKGEIAIRKISPAYRAAELASEALTTASKDVEGQIKLLDTAIGTLAKSATDDYKAMAEGYATQTELVRAGAETQVEAINTRYDTEEANNAALMLSVQEAEQRKVDLIIGKEGEKLAAYEASHTAVMAGLALQEDAERLASGTKIAGLTAEIAKVNEAMGKEFTSRSEAAAKIKSLDEQRVAVIAETETAITARKTAALTDLKTKYKAYIDALNAEARRHADRAIALDREIEDSKRTLEQKLRDLEYSQMTDYETYQAKMADIAKLQAQAREAASSGEFDRAREDLSRAKELTADLNTEVKEGEKILIDKVTAAGNSKDALESIYGTEQELLQQESAAYKESAEKLDKSAKAKQASLDEVNVSLVDLAKTANEGAELKVSTNLDEANGKVKDLQKLMEKRDYLVDVDVRLQGQSEQVKSIMSDMEKGIKGEVDFDVTDAILALTDLKDEADRTNDMKLKMDAQAAIDALKLTKDSLTETKAKLDAVDDPKYKNMAAALTVETPNLEEVNEGLNALWAPEAEHKTTLTVVPDTKEVDQKLVDLGKKRTKSVHTVWGFFQGAWDMVMGAFGFAQGGFIPAGDGVPSLGPSFQSMRSGVVPGVGDRDSVPRLLPAGAFVIRKQAVESYGRDALLALLDGVPQLPQAVSSMRGYIRTMLTPGEVVAGPEKVAALGLQQMYAINAGKGAALSGNQPLYFADGGVVNDTSVDFVGASMPGPSSAASSAASQSTSGAGGAGGLDKVMIDLRTEVARATVTATREEAGNLVALLQGLKDRAR